MLSTLEKVKEVFHKEYVPALEEICGHKVRVIANRRRGEWFINTVLFMDECVYCFSANQRQIEVTISRDYADRGSVDLVRIYFADGFPTIYLNKWDKRAERKTRIGFNLFAGAVLAHAIASKLGLQAHQNKIATNSGEVSVYFEAPSLRVSLALGNGETKISVRGGSVQELVEETAKIVALHTL